MDLEKMRMDFQQLLEVLMVKR
nr:hypothetical protein [Tanacetum cinerariifolium]